MLGYGLKWFGYNPGHPYWLLFAAPFVAFGTGSLFTLMGSMIADVCDLDELQTGRRREGVKLVLKSGTSWRGQAKTGPLKEK